MGTHKSTALSIVLSVLGAAVIVGGAAYYYKMNQAAQPTTTVSTAPTSMAATVTSSTPNPSSSPSQQELTPEDYQSIILEKNSPNYVKSKGIIKILFSQSATISFTIEKAKSPNTKFNGDSLPFITYINKGTIPKDPNNDYVYGKYGDYSYSFNAPDIPGKYDLVFDEAELESQRMKDVNSKYEITVIDKVDSQLLASKIVDRAIFAKLNEANPRDWKITSQNIKSVGTNWDVAMQINYSSCGIDFNSNVCSAKNVKGHYLINKNSGIVTEENL